ncbi:MAG: hypothetical protein GQ574_20130 [Crocinitomix sp.]|nr:hypothetical protein [Crocinitomix sp.]
MNLNRINKRSLLLLFCFFVNSFGAHAQTTVVELLPESDTYSSISSIQLTIKRQSVDSIPRLNFWGGGALFTTSGITFGGASFFIPRKLLVSIDLGWGANLDATIFLKSKTKPIEILQSIAATATHVYKTSIPSAKLKSIGLNIGGGGSTLGSNYYSKYPNNSFVSFGFSRISSKHAYWEINTNYGQRKGSSLFRVNLNAIHFFNHTFYPSVNQTIVPNGDPLAGTSQAFDSFISEDQFAADNAAYPLRFGAQFFIDGYATIWSKSGILGFRYKFGIGSPPSRRLGAHIIGGFGLNFTFI